MCFCFTAFGGSLPSLSHFGGQAPWKSRCVSNIGRTMKQIETAISGPDICSSVHPNSLGSVQVLEPAWHLMAHRSSEINGRRKDNKITSKYVIAEPLHLCWNAEATLNCFAQIQTKDLAGARPRWLITGNNQWTHQGPMHSVIQCNFHNSRSYKALASSISSRTAGSRTTLKGIGKESVQNKAGLGGTTHLPALLWDADSFFFAVDPLSDDNLQSPGDCVSKLQQTATGRAESLARETERRHDHPL